jgi:hypothetical protein
LGAAWVDATNKGLYQTSASVPPRRNNTEKPTLAVSAEQDLPVPWYGLGVKVSVHIFVLLFDIVGVFCETVLTLDPDENLCSNTLEGSELAYPSSKAQRCFLNTPQMPRAAS